MKKPDSKHGVLLKNTLMLYILQFSGYFFSLIVVPYETRVLGPEIFGLVGAAAAAMVYFQNIIDFGFLLSATEDAAKHRDDKEYLGKLLSAVTASKLCIAAVCAIVLAILCSLIGSWGNHTGFYFLYFVSIFLASIMPDFIYRGLEQMEIITVRAVAIKAFFTVMIFIFLKDKTQYYVIPLLNIIGNGGAFWGVYLHLSKKLDIRFRKTAPSEILRVIKTSSPFFFSRIATTVYTATNTIILDIVSATGAVTGYYSSADKLITTAKSAVSPISDSLYPYMVKNRDFKLVRKVLLVCMPVIIVGCLIVGIFAPQLCSWFFGAEYAKSADVLRVMLPVVVVILPSYILGFPTLSPMGLAKYANISTIVGSAFYVIAILILFFTGNVTMTALGILTSITETIILLFRLTVVVRNRDRMRGAQEA